MPSPVMTGPGTAGSGQERSAKNGDAPVIPTVPFIRASMLHSEPMGFDQSRLLAATTTDLGVHDVTAYGYVRNVVIKVTATGASDATDAVFAADGPWNVLQDIILSEPNGATIAQFNNGFELYLANKYGGYLAYNDPRRLLTTDSDGNFAFTLRIPLELNQRHGLGALPNQNAASPFKVRLKLAPSTTVYTDVPDAVLPTVRVQTYLEAYDQPSGSTGSAQNMTTPPALNTTQYWSTQSYNVNAGEQRIRLERVGNYIRNLLFVFYSAARADGETEWPEELRLTLDTVPIEVLDRALWRQRIYERYGYLLTSLDTAGSRDNGVYPYDFCHEFTGHVGMENNDLWLPTLTSSRLEIQGNFTGAGTLYVLTNDVSTAGNVFM